MTIQLALGKVKQERCYLVRLALWLRLVSGKVLVPKFAHSQDACCLLLLVYEVSLLPWAWVTSMELVVLTLE